MDRILKSRTGIVLISIFWGLGLSALFKKSCEGRKCYMVLHRGPDPNELGKNVYRYGDQKCYQYRPYLSKC